MVGHEGRQASVVGWHSMSSVKKWKVCGGGMQAVHANCQLQGAMALEVCRCGGG